MSSAELIEWFIVSDLEHWQEKIKIKTMSKEQKANQLKCLLFKGVKKNGSQSA